VPVHPEVAAELEAGLECVGVASVPGVEKPAERGFEIGLVCDALLDRCLLGRALDAVSDLASEGRVPMSMSQRYLVGLAGSLEPFSRVFANRLQHLEPVLCLDLHERLVHERLEPVECGRLRVGADGFDIFERTAACEEGHAPEEPLLRLRQQRMAPVDRRPERLLPPRAVAIR